MKLPQLILAHVQVENKKCDWMEMPNEWLYGEKVIYRFTEYFGYPDWEEEKINPNHFFNKAYKKHFNGLVYGGFENEKDFKVLCTKWKTSLYFDEIDVKKGDLIEGLKYGNKCITLSKPLYKNKVIGNLLEAYAETGQIENELSNKIFK